MMARKPLILLLVLFTAWAQAYVADPNRCKECHKVQYEFWREKQMHHSAAYLTLYQKKDHVNPECIGCHTLGYKNGGFEKILKPLPDNDIEKTIEKVFKGDPKEKPLDSREDPKRFEKLHKKYWEVIDDLYANKKITKNFLGVQCEHCHGDREGHPMKKVAVKPRTATTRCTQCHRQPNAEPVTAEMKKKIACPLITK